MTDSKKPLSFTIEASKRTLYLKASSLAEKELWISALKLASVTNKTFTAMPGDERAKVRIQLGLDQVETILISRTTTVCDSVRMLHRQLCLGQRNDEQIQQIKRTYANRVLCIVNVDGSRTELDNPELELWSQLCDSAVGLEYCHTAPERTPDRVASSASASATSTLSSSEEQPTSRVASSMPTVSNFSTPTNSWTTSSTHAEPSGLGSADNDPTNSASDELQAPPKSPSAWIASSKREVMASIQSRRRSVRLRPLGDEQQSSEPPSPNV
jgi:hypothetical protein